jgi:Family of unknown function (DUF5317)
VFLLVLLGLSIVSVAVAGGHLSALGSLRFRHAWAVVAGLGLQIVIISVIPSAAPVPLAVAHLLSYVFIGVFVFANRTQPGLWILGAGWGSNLIVIAANGGVMPTASFAVASSARRVADNEFVNSRALAHPKLQFLGDIFAIPRSWPLHNVFSIGDILIVVGAFVLLHTLCGSRLAPYLRWGRKRTPLAIGESSSS